MSETVLVTGGSGFIAGHCVARLLQDGWRVRTTVRSERSVAKAREAVATLGAPADQVESVTADLEQDAGWAEAVRGAHYVLHVASPFPAVTPRDDEALVRPARDGTLRVLRAAREAGVKRVVVTSSIASVAYGHGERPGPFTEEDWSDATNRKETTAYERSKTLAERAAWDFINGEGRGMEMATVNPSAVLGPVTGAGLSSSIQIVQKLMDGSVPGCARLGWPLVDVRDVADLHVRAMVAPEAAGRRFIASGPFMWMEEIAQVLKEELGAAARRVPTRRIPDWMVRVVAWFDPVVRARLFELGVRREVSSEQAQRLLGWTPRSNREAIVATARSLLERPGGGGE